MLIPRILAFAAFAGLQACGQLADSPETSTKTDAVAGSDSADSPDTSTNSDAVAGTDSRAPDTTADSEVRDAAPDSGTSDETRDSEVDAGSVSGTVYAGSVTAGIELYQGKQWHGLSTYFWTVGTGLPAQQCASKPTGGCCELTRQNLSGPTPAVPNAGNVTIDLNQRLFATLTAPNYTESNNVTWGAGDRLGVSAAGGAVAAFSGILDTTAAISGVNPAFGTTPVAVALASGFQVSWTPEGKEGEVMLLDIFYPASGWPIQIECSVPDSAGSVVVDASVLAPLAAPLASSTSTADISLTRSITSNISAANATISLGGYFELDMPATFH
jgi:hypothetical protein